MKSIKRLGCFPRRISSEKRLSIKEMSRHEGKFYFVVHSKPYWSLCQFPFYWFHKDKKFLLWWWPKLYAQLNFFCPKVLLIFFSLSSGVSCDSCIKGNFRGLRFKCLICYDYDLCATCYEAGATNTRHTADHPMQCILTRSDYGIKWWLYVLVILTSFNVL